MSSRELEEKWEELISRLRAEGILKSEKVVRALRKVPRYRFLPDRLKPYAHMDTPLPIGYGQTVSAPHGPTTTGVGPGDTW